MGNKDGKSIQKELSEEQSEILKGKKIGEQVKGDEIGFIGYEFLITGGSDDSGTPMRKDIELAGKKKILCVKGIGVKKKRHGQKQRKTVSGSIIYEKTSQLNLKILKQGKEDLFAKAPEEAEKTKEKKE